MKPKRLYIDFINDIFETIHKIDKFIEGMTLDQFLADEKTVLYPRSQTLFRNKCTREFAEKNIEKIEGLRTWLKEKIRN